MATLNELFLRRFTREFIDRGGTLNGKAPIEAFSQACLIPFGRNIYQTVLDVCSLDSEAWPPDEVAAVVAAVEGRVEEIRAEQAAEAAEQAARAAERAAERQAAREARQQERAAADDVEDHWTPDELGTARRFASEHAGQVLWCEELQRWLVAADGVWTVDNRVEHRRLIIETAERQERDNQNQERRGRVRFTSASHTANSLTLAKPSLAVELDDFDTDPWLLNCPSGVLDLRTLQMRERQASDLFMLMCRVDPLPEWTPEATPLWTAHLRRMVKGDEEFAVWLRRMAGISLIGDQDAKPHLAPQLNGDGRNGKGSFLHTLVWALGDYAQFASSRLLTAQEGIHSTERAGLARKRLVVIEEVKRINSSLFKDTTGGGVMRARLMRQDDQDIEKSWTFWFNNNGAMTFGGDQSDGLWERIPRMYLGEGIPEGDRVYEQAVLLQSEAPGVLAWMLLGLREYHEKGIWIPERVRVWSGQSRADLDYLESYILEHCEVAGAYAVKGSDFMAGFKDYCDRQGLEKPRRNAVYQQLRDDPRFLVFDPESSGVVWFQGLRIRPFSFAEASASLN